MVARATTLVRRLGASLDAVLPHWRRHIEELGQLPLIRARMDGWRPSDAEVVHALLLAFLSAMTDWRRIQESRPELLGLLDGRREPRQVAQLSETSLATIEHWFLERRLGSVLLRRQLFWLRSAATVFVRMQNEGGTVDGFFEAAREADQDLVSLLSDQESDWKLPGVGVALAAEFLKNLGYDEFKPDRHTIRMLGPSRLAVCDRLDPLSVRRHGIALARAAGIPAAELDQMLWLYCARGYGGTCGAEPRCGQCRMRTACRLGREWNVSPS